MLFNATAFKDELIINKYIWGIMAKFELHNKL